VVADCEFLDDATMKRIAREFNQSETTFVLPPTRAEATWRLRCFTPAGVEAFGAGHNALGAWWWIAQAGRVPLKDGRNRFHQELGERVLPVEVIASGGKPQEIVMTQTAPEFGAILADKAGLASALDSMQATLAHYRSRSSRPEPRTCWSISATGLRSIAPSRTLGVSP